MGSQRGPAGEELPDSFEKLAKLVECTRPPQDGHATTALCVLSGQLKLKCKGGSAGLAETSLEQ